jgi:hypothetical protein
MKVHAREGLRAQSADHTVERGILLDGPGAVYSIAMALRARGDRTLTPHVAFLASGHRTTEVDRCSAETTASIAWKSYVGLAPERFFFEVFFLRGTGERTKDSRDHPAISRAGGINGVNLSKSSWHVPEDDQPRSSARNVMIIFSRDTQAGPSCVASPRLAPRRASSRPAIPDKPAHVTSPATC